MDKLKGITKTKQPVITENMSEEEESDAITTPVEEEEDEEPEFGKNFNTKTHVNTVNLSKPNPRGRKRKNVTESNVEKKPRKMKQTTLSQFKPMSKEAKVSILKDLIRKFEADKDEQLFILIPY